METTLSFSGGFWIPLICLIVISVVLRLYRKTRPEVHPGIRLMLVLLRTAALLSIVLLIADPVLRSSRQESERASLCILIDGSASMTLRDRGMARSRVLADLLKDPVWKNLSAAHPLTASVFRNDSLVRMDDPGDSIVFSGLSTNLAAALDVFQNEAGSRHIGGVFLLTDGRNNRGEYPLESARRLSFPVYSVLFGGSGQPPDAVLAGVSANDVAILGSEMPVEAVVRGPGLEGRTVTVRLYSGKDLLEEKRVIIPAGGLDQTVRFTTVPVEEGFRSYHVQILPLVDELTPENNRRDFAVQVLKGGLRVLLVADAPHPDAAAVRRALAGREDLSLIPLTVKSGTAFYEGAWPEADLLKDLDAVVLHHIPSGKTPPFVWSRVRDLLIRGKKPVLFVPGDKPDLAALSAVSDLLPVGSWRLTVSRQVLPEARMPFLSPLGGGDEQGYADVDWKSVPPLLSAWSDVKARPESRIWLEAAPVQGSASSESLPVILARDMQGDRSMAILGTGLYRWDLSTAPGMIPLLERVMNDAVRWLAVPGGGRPVRLLRDRRTVNAGEAFPVRVQVFDEWFRPVTDARVRINIRSDSSASDHDLQHVREGRYEWETVFHNDGILRIEAEAERGGRLIGRDTTFLAVRGYHAEFMDTRSDPVLLRRISEVSGGWMTTPDSLAGRLETLRFAPRRKVTEKETSFFPRGWILGWVVFLLTAEWLIRKRLGMI
ncbi:VWA domain-containing protein [bacterium]|nr:VWA domain-containing protein [bacterium]